MTPADIACYRANYETKGWKEFFSRGGDVPKEFFIAATVAIATLCDEVERLQRQLKKRRKGKC